MNSKGLHHQQGIALLAVLAVSVALSLLITSATVMMQRQLNIGETAQGQFRQKVAAYAKVQELAYILATQRLTPAGVSSGKNETGSQRVEGRFISTLSNDEIRVDGFKYEDIIRGENIRFSIQATDGLIPINTNDQLWLKMWLSSYDIDSFLISKLADHLADYADEDDWSRPAGAEAFNYSTSSLSSPTNFLFQRCSELYQVFEAHTYIDEAAIDTDECSLNRSPTVNLNAMPLNLLKRIFGKKGENTYMQRSNAEWLQTNTEAILSFNSLNNISENYVSVVSKSSVIIKVSSESASKVLRVERGVNKIKPLSARL